MLFFAELLELGELPPLEIEKVELFDELPKEWTYPEIQPLLVERIKKLSFHSVTAEASFLRFRIGFGILEEEKIGSMRVERSCHKWRKASRFLG